jgi:hypothetical protein
MVSCCHDDFSPPDSSLVGVVGVVGVVGDVDFTWLKSFSPSRVLALLLLRTDFVGLVADTKWCRAYAGRLDWPRNFCCSYGWLGLAWLDGPTNLCRAYGWLVVRTVHRLMYWCITPPGHGIENPRPPAAFTIIGTQVYQKRGVRHLPFHCRQSLRDSAVATPLLRLELVNAIFGFLSRSVVFGCCAWWVSSLA